MIISVPKIIVKHHNNVDIGIKTSKIPMYPPSVLKALCTSDGKPVPLGSRFIKKFIIEYAVFTNSVIMLFCDYYREF